METACHYFKNDRCIAKHWLRQTIKMSVIAFCTTEEHISYPIYVKIVSRKKASESKKRASHYIK